MLKGVEGALMNNNSFDSHVDPTTASDPLEPIEPTCEPSSATNFKSIHSRLQAWVNSVEKDTQTQVQEYLEQIDAGQNGE